MAGAASSVPTPSNESPVWNEQDPMASLAGLYRGTVEKGQEQINWCRKKL
jgi:hypothetical protein